MPFKLSNLNSNLALTLGYLNPALNNSTLVLKIFLRTLPLYTGQLCRGYKATENFGKLSSDRRMTALYRAVVHRFNCSRLCHVLVQVDLALDKIVGRLAHNTKPLTKPRYRKRA